MKSARVTDCAVVKVPGCTPAKVGVAVTLWKVLGSDRRCHFRRPNRRCLGSGEAKCSRLLLVRTASPGPVTWPKIRSV